MKNSRAVKLFFDGGCRPNPGVMEIAVVALGQTYIRKDIGHGTSMDAEWLALIHAVEIAVTLGTMNVVLLGDAASVVAQANGTIKCRGAAIEHQQRLAAIKPPAMPLRVRYIKRSQNLAGIALARLRER